MQSTILCCPFEFVAILLKGAAFCAFTIMLKQICRRIDCFEATGSGGNGFYLDGSLASYQTIRSDARCSLIVLYKSCVRSAQYSLRDVRCWKPQMFEGRFVASPFTMIALQLVSSVYLIIH